ncbi:MAG: class I SAM-dependent methyltransferase [Cellvibrionaceae bacterium]|nr:class I SAM-dependent methyltransferase [Cellvibrionaceae bacterium]
MSLQYWQQFYQNLGAKPSLQDDYLCPLLRQHSGRALDIGCGLGQDSWLLRQLGFDVISSDFSAEALALGIQQGFIDQPLQADLRQLGAMLAPRSFDLLLANLSLHYFEREQMAAQILPSLFALLKPGGQFVGCFNSLDDTNYGADRADADGYYRDDYAGEARLKVFYSEPQLRTLFEPYGQCQINASSTERFGRRKSVYLLSLELKV